MNKRVIIFLVVLAVILAYIDLLAVNYKEGMLNNNTSATTTTKNNSGSTNSSVVVYVSQPYKFLALQLFNASSVVSLGDILLSTSITNSSGDIIVSNGFYNFIYPNKVKWIILLKTDEIVFAYNTHNEFFNISDNSSVKLFFDYITSGKVRIGSVNPLISSTGIYFQLILKIAGEIFYRNSSYYLQRCLVSNCLVEFSSDLELLNVFKNGGVQLAVTYKSLADQNGLNYVELPDYLNFGKENYSSFYSKFNYTLELYNQDIYIAGKPNFIYITALTDKGVKLIYQLITSNYLFNRQLTLLFTSSQELPPQIYFLYQEGVLKSA